MGPVFENLSKYSRPLKRYGHIFYMFTVLFSINIFFSKNINVYAIFNDQSFNETLTNDIVSFEQLGPVCENSS